MKKSKKDSGLKNFVDNIGLLENLYIGLGVLLLVFLLDVFAFKYSLLNSIFYSFISLIMFYIFDSFIFLILHPLFSIFSEKSMKETFFKVSFLELLYIFIGLLTSGISLLIESYTILLLIFLVLVNIGVWILFSYLFAFVYKIKPSQAFFSLVVLVTFLTIIAVLFFLSTIYIQVSHNSFMI